MSSSRANYLDWSFRDFVKSFHKTREIISSTPITLRRTPSHNRPIIRRCYDTWHATNQTINKHNYPKHIHERLRLFKVHRQAIGPTFPLFLPLLNLYLSFLCIFFCPLRFPQRYTAVASCCCSRNSTPSTPSSLQNPWRFTDPIG